MEKSAPELAERFRTYAEEIESYSLNDRTAWERLSRDVHSILSSLPGEAQVLRELLDSLCTGAFAIGEKRLTDYLSAIDALASGFDAAGRFLEDGAQDTSPLQDALATLSDSFPISEGEGGGSATSVRTPSASLDDAAALLVQVDPQEPESLDAFAVALREVLSSGSHSEAVRGCLLQIDEKTREIMEGGAGNVEAAIEEIGGLFEELPELEGGDAGPNRLPAAPAALGDAGGRSDTAGGVPTGSGSGSAEVEDTAADSDVVDHMPSDPDLELLGEYVDESNEQIASAEEALLQLETDPEDAESVGMVFRAFHTIKGTSAFLELSIISEMAHYAENLLSRVRDKEIRYSGGYADLSLKALDMLKELVAGVQGALGGGSLLKPAGYDRLLQTLTNPEAHGVSEADVETEPLRIGDILVAQGKLTREEVESAASRPRIGDILVAQGKADRERIETAVGDASAADIPLGVQVLQDKAASIEDVGKALRAQQRIKAPQKAADASVRVSTERLDRLIDMVGELVIAHSMVAQDDIVMAGTHHDLVKKVSHASKIVRELQDISMSLRMVPLKGTFNKMARLVRDVARKLGKKVEFVTDGEETEIDRNLVDVINDPLVHMIRNAMDHGIEMPADRRAAGKSETGVVKLSAYHSAGNVVVEIKDDGKGLNRNAILDKAVSNGLVGDASGLSDREIWNLIFEPGFSTAAEVTDVSGRGVGMDVVKKNIESLRGQTEIHSVDGRGSTFKMSLPLTLAIIDGMVVRVGSESYVIPTASIVKSIKPGAEDISTVYGKGEMIGIQGELIPVARLADLYDIEDAGRDREKELVIIVEDERSKAGLVIDELMGRQQVVIKTLGETMRNIPGISGSAIMPNGRVGLILDVGGLLRYANSVSVDGGKDGRQLDEEAAVVSA